MPLEFPDGNGDDKNDIEDPFECENIEVRAGIKRNKFYSYVQQIASPYLNQKEPDAEEKSGANLQHSPLAV